MLTITPSPTTTVGLQVFANANLQASGGTVTFRLFAPGDTVTPVFTSTKPVNGVSINSDAFTTTRAGTFTWTGAFSGDANQNPQSAGPVGVVVDKARTVLSVRARPLTGGALRATATLAGGFNPTGTITFLCTRAQNDRNPCDSTPVFSVTVPVNGARDYDSGPFVPALSGTYRWRASYSGDQNSRGSSLTPCLNPDSTVEAVLPPAGRFNPLSPSRLLDTRDGGAAGAIGPGATLDVQVAGLRGIPATGVLAVAMNVTVTQPSAAGFLTVLPAGAPRPLAANLNFTPGRTIPNLVVAKLGAGGKVSLFNSAGTTHVVLDVAGWFSDAPVGNDGRFQALSPARLLDTRAGGVPLGPGASLDLQVTGQGGVPATGPGAVVVNVAATDTSAAGFLTLHPAGEVRPNAANLNFAAGETASNRAMVKLGQGGKVTIFNGLGSTNVVVDVCGWFTDASQAGSGGAFTPLVPARLLDTAAGGGPRLVAGLPLEVQVTGQAGVPASGVGAVVLNVCAHSSSAAGFVTLFRAGTARPGVSDLNFAAGEVRSNLVIVPLTAAGRATVVPSTACHVVLDVAGFLS